MRTQTCRCEFKLLQRHGIYPRVANKSDGPEESGWSMTVSSDAATNISHCPFCGGTLSERREPNYAPG